MSVEALLAWFEGRTWETEGWITTINTILNESRKVRPTLRPRVLSSQRCCPHRTVIAAGAFRVPLGRALRGDSRA